MYQNILVAIDATHPEELKTALEQTTQIGLLMHATVHVLHVARSHIISGDITGGSSLGVRSPDDDIEDENREAVQDLVDQLAAAGVDAHGEVVSATEHDTASVILQRARELAADLLVLEYQHQRDGGHLFRHSVAEQIINQHPPISILLARPRR